MAKLSKEERATMEAGAEAQARVNPKTGDVCKVVNPHLWSSRMWDAFEFGRYIQERGLSLGPPPYWERGRGNTFHNPAGMSWKFHYSKNGFGITRAD